MEEQSTENIEKQPRFLVIVFQSEKGPDTQQAQADYRKFSTGSKGYGYYGKIRIAGKRYQVSLSVVEIGSKNGGE